MRTPEEAAAIRRIARMMSEEAARLPVGSYVAHRLEEGAEEALVLLAAKTSDDASS